MWRVWIGLVCVCAFMGCEELRPTVSKEALSGHSKRVSTPGLQGVKRLYRNGREFPAITARLRQSILSSSTEEQAEPAQQMLVQVHIEWYQRLRIAEAVIPEVRDVGVLYGALLADIVAWNEAKKDGATTVMRWVVAPKKNKVTDVHSFLMPLRPSGFTSVAQAADVRALLLQEVDRLAEARSSRTQAFAKAAKRFLALESQWGYRASRSDKAAQERAKAQEMRLFIDQYKGGGLADNGWLALAVRLGHGLAKPAVPLRSTLQSAAVVLNKNSSTAGRSLLQVLQDLGAGSGDTQLEQLWRSWRTLQATVHAALSKHKRGFKKSDGLELWRHLQSYWRFDQGPLTPSPSGLHKLGADVRSSLVAAWLRSMSLSSPLSKRDVNRLERLIAGSIPKNKGVADVTQWYGLWVMATLTIQDTIGTRLGGRSGSRPPRLAHGGEYEKRALFLPGAGRLEGFPSMVKGCLKKRSQRVRGCLRRIVDNGVRMNERRAVKPKNAHRLLDRPNR